jgi:gluconokinase
VKRLALVIVVMGVSGSGKTTIGSLLARQLNCDFADADTYHSAANVEKMRNGIPLTDADRLPWLEALRDLIARWIDDRKSAVLACSALKESYRERLRVDEQVRFVYLKGNRDLLFHRLRERRDHYMKQQMLESQLGTLEEPANAIVVDANETPENIVCAIRSDLALK